MRQQLAGLIQSNFFFITLMCFVTVLPLSNALVSIFAVTVFVVAIVEDSWNAKWQRLKERKGVLMIPLIFAIYIISTLNTLEGNTLYDIKKSLFILLFPLAFALGKEINSKQKRMILYAFALAIFIASLIALIRWLNTPEGNNFSVHKASLVSHIRFSFQLILIAWFFILLGKENLEYSVQLKKVMVFWILAIYYIGFLFFQQSLTGIVALMTSGVFFLIYMSYKRFKKYRLWFVFLGLLLLSAPLIYLNSCIRNFYDIKEVDKEKVDKYTAQGNPYQHNFKNKSVENGNYVFLYVCEEEMRTEWNKVSDKKFDSAGVTGYSLRSTLVRYLSSKGLRKDAEGVKALTKQDIRNVESGMANVIYDKKYSLYPRIYQTIWEYYEYTTSGNSNNMSFSQRIEFTKAALTIIKQYPWFGVGTGRWKDSFADAFIQNSSRLSKEHYASSHNQYLNYMVKFGIIGFVLIMFCLIYPVVKSKRYRDPLFLIFLVFMFFANFADSNLESHMGSSFFFFFYCFFLTGNGLEYLKLQKEE